METCVGKNETEDAPVATRTESERRHAGSGAIAPRGVLVNARTRSVLDIDDEKSYRTIAKAENLDDEDDEALDMANKKVKEAERSAKVFMQKSEREDFRGIEREQQQTVCSKDAAENRELKLLLLIVAPGLTTMGTPNVSTTRRSIW